MVEALLEAIEEEKQVAAMVELKARFDEEWSAYFMRPRKPASGLISFVRGICCLRPGIPGISDNIRVISIVAGFLEHSRIYYSHNDGDAEIFLGSADLMSRNLLRRVEVLFPIEDRRLVRYLRDHILEVCLADNVKAREMQQDGTYLKRLPKPGEESVNSQEAIPCKEECPNDSFPRSVAYCSDRVKSEIQLSPLFSEGCNRLP